MPIFDFECDNCDKTVEKIMSYEDSEKKIKCECGKGHLNKKASSKLSFNLKGRWFKNTGSY